MFSVAPVTPRLWWHDIYMIYMIFLGLVYLMVSKTFFMLYFRTTDRKDASPQPCASGIIKEK